MIRHNVHLPEQLKERLQKIAEKTGLTASEIARRGIEHAVAQLEKKVPMTTAAQVIDTIRRGIFGDTSVPVSTTRENLEEIRDEIEIMLESLPTDEE